MTLESTRYLRELRRLLDEHFNLQELRLLCFDLGVDYEHLPGDVKLAKVNEMILYLARNGRLDDLLTLLREERPYVVWPAVPPPEQQVLDEKATISDSAREAALQEYLSKMTRLLLKEGLRDVGIGSPVYSVAQAYTEAVFGRLDKHRYLIVIRFLLQNRLFSLLNLVGLDLSGAELSGIRLYEANLTQADLSEANLSQTQIVRTNLSWANLYRAELSRAVLSDVDLTQANLRGANLALAYMINTRLDDADFRETNLSQASFVFLDKQGDNIVAEINPPLARVRTLEGAVMPNGRLYDPSIPIEDQLWSVT
ncbi:MAG TPA: pentapeptide repeat-containing protein [Anaerolineae bacterium]